MIHADAPTVAVIGGGFSGLLTAIHLLRDDPLVRVHLIERSAAFGRGRAFATANPDHLLNVRVANMSAFADDPDHFRRWLKAPAGEMFITRGCYGDYLQDILAAQLDREGKARRLVLDHGLAVSATPGASGGWSVGLADGRVIAAQAVVLALGFLDSAPPTPLAPEVAAHPAYVADPWAIDLAKVPAGEVLLLGTGLTMVDVALSLDNPRRRITAMSRRGLLPLVHGHAVSTPAPGMMGKPLSALRRLRRHSDTVGWRTAVDSVRWITPQIWQVWTVRERRQFLRHLRPWWDIHRHRMAPAVDERLTAMRAAGRLEVRAAKIGTVKRAGAKLDVTFRPRGFGQEQTARFAAVINCTSPGSDVARIESGVVADLRRQGLLRADALGLGLEIGPNWSVMGAAGRRPTPGLFAVGPLARSAVWEAIAVPDLRRHAQEAAGAVLGFLAKAPAAPISPAPAFGIEAQAEAAWP